jgi:hypothetical protein
MVAIPKYGADALRNDLTERVMTVKASSSQVPSDISTNRRWLTVLDAARYVGFQCENGRAPNSIYQIATQIGSKLNGRWLIHPDDLDSYVRALRVAR